MQEHIQRNHKQKPNHLLYVWFVWQDLFHLMFLILKVILVCFAVDQEEVEGLRAAKVIDQHLIFKRDESTESSDRMPATT